MTDPNNPNSQPTVSFWWWGDQWTASDWMTWHRAMSAAFGRDVANRRFVAAWSDAGDSAPLNARTFDSAFRAYAKANGFLDALYNGLGALAAPLGAALDGLGATTSIGTAAQSAGKGIENTGSAVKYLLPLAVLGIVAIYAAPYIAPAFKKAKTALAK